MLTQFIKMPKGFSKTTGLPFLPPNQKGIAFTAEHKNKIGNANRGKKKPPFTLEHRIKLGLKSKGNKYRLGIPHTEETKRKMSLTRQNKVWVNKLPFCKICNKKLTAMKSIYCSRHRGEPNKGENNVNWNGGVTSSNEKFRKSPEYRLWRTAVFERDKYTCVWCGQIGNKLNADHIKPFSSYPELRLAIDNGRTLCLPCHKTTDTYLVHFKKK